MYQPLLKANNRQRSSPERPLKAKRLSGGGRHTLLTREQELELLEWVMGYVVMMAV